MAIQAQDQESFTSNKTYALMELVRGTSPMANKGPDQTVFSFPVVALWEALLLLGTTLFVFIFS
ncbi:MAG: cytochrome B6, partial [Chloroflexota bacterium]|nr:cytochrome B6 [Chloroflexota bacterium]